MSKTVHHLTAIGLNIKAASEVKKRKKKQTLASVAKQVRKAGLEVARYDIDIDGKISVITGKPEAAAETETPTDIKRLM